MTRLPDCRNVCFSRIGSNAGSSSSPTFSSRQGFPKRTAFSRLRRKSLSDSLITSTPLSRSCKWHGKCKKKDKPSKQRNLTCILLSPYWHLLSWYLTHEWKLTRFLTHLLACPCGSIKSGHRLENCTITPFSTLKLSCKYHGHVLSFIKESSLLKSWLYHRIKCFLFTWKNIYLW